MNRRILLSLGLLGAAIVFAALALESPVKSLPALATCTPRMTAASCQYVLVQSKAQIAAAQFPLSMFQSEAEVAVGFASAGVLLLLSSLSRFIPDVRLNFKDRTRKAFMLASVVGASLFCVFVVVDILREFGSWGAINAWAYNAPPSILGLTPTTVFGLTGFSCMVIAMLGFTLSHSGGGLWSAFSRFATHFAAPAILLLEVGLFLVSPSEMTRQVANFTKPLELGGAYLISNWSVLIVSSVLALCGRFRLA